MDLDFAQRLGILLYSAGSVAMSLMVRRQLYGTRDEFHDASLSAQARARRWGRAVACSAVAAWVLSIPALYLCRGTSPLASFAMVLLAGAGIVAAIGLGTIPPEAIPTFDERDFE